MVEILRKRYLNLILEAKGCNYQMVDIRLIGGMIHFIARKTKSEPNGSFRQVCKELSLYFRARPQWDIT
jgi:hypothetical protein